MGGPLSFCACAGAPAPATAVAVTRATRRAAGVTRGGLIGLSVRVMSAWLRTVFPRNLVVRRRAVNAGKGLITGPLWRRFCVEIRRQRGGACASDREHRDVGCGTTFDQPFCAQRCSTLHGDGRDG